MALLKIRTYGDPVLRRKAEEIPEITPAIKKLVADMFDTMYDAPGIGLAAPQVGASVRLIVMDLWDGESSQKEPYVLINPVITSTSGLYNDEEGCLSFPELRIQVPRYQTLTLEALDLEGKKFSFENAEGLLARCIQHEMDHLEGVLFVDRLSAPQRILINGKLKKMAKNSK